MRKTREHELKLTVSDGFRLSDLGEVELPSRDFVSNYFDTPDLSLARNRITLRHRAEEGSRLWQLKIPSGAARIEIEVPGPPAHPPNELLALLLVHLRGVEPARVARLRTRRKTLRTDGAEIVDDSVSVMEGQRVRERFRELEVELVDDGDERTLRRLEKKLLGIGAESADFRPKLYRALDFSPVADTSPLPRDASPQQVVGAALQEQHAELLAHDPGTRLGTDPEDLHQMRVATRRARAFLRAARPVVDQEWADDLRAELGWLGAALGPGRDLDVLVERMRDQVSRLGDEGTAVRGLVDGIERRRRKARASAVAGLSEDRYLALLDRLEAPKPPPASTGTSSTLAELWWAELVRTRRRFDKLDRESSDDELHAARIGVKRTRYAAELAANELGVPGERFVDAAKVVQDVLGEHQDAFVAEEHIRAWAEGKPEAGDAVRKLLKREHGRRRKARAEWPQAWRLLDRRARKARP